MTLELAVGRKALSKSKRATWLALGSSALLLSLLVAAYLNLTARSDDLQDSIREDALWAVYQIDREADTLATAIRDAVEDAGLDAARREALTLRYDIVYSRMAIVDKARYAAYFAGDPRIIGERARVRGLILSMEPVFNGIRDGRTGAAELASLLPTAEELPRATGALALRTNAAVSSARADIRAELLRLQDTAAWIVLALVVLSGLLVLSLTRRLRSTRAVKEQIQKAADQLQIAFVAAEAGNRAKSEFMATMGHEIRTPLNAILGMAELLSMSDLSPDHRDSVDAIAASGTALLEVINEILDFTKIEHGDLGTEAVPFDPAELVRETFVVVHGRARERGNSLHLADTRVRGLFMGDPARLRRVLLNLMSNAVKFTENGQVEVRLLETGFPNAPRLRFEVRDSGIGISEDLFHLLFLPFSQIDGSISRRFGGTGLGLAICKRIVEAAGGAIGVESEPGLGSRFWFEVPAPRAIPEAPRTETAAMRATPKSGSETQARNILVVEDNAFNRKVAGRFLEKLGHVATFAENGEIAVRLVGEGRYDLVLMDMQMPIMDGIEATRAIRATGSRVPIVALTANASETDRERCSAAGMEGFVTKPLPMHRLQALVATWCGGTSPAGTADAPRGPADADDTTAGIEIDEDRLADLIEVIGEDGLAELRDAFAQDAATLLADLATAMAANDPARTDAILHTIKGAASNVGYRGIAELAERMRRSFPREAERKRLTDELGRLSAKDTTGKEAA